MNSKLVKKIILGIVICILLIALIVGGYLGYAYLAFDRLSDNLDTEISWVAKEKAEVGKEYKILTYNVGYGANCDEYSFFMDGGEESIAFSKANVRENISGTIENIVKNDPDIILLQEVDVDAKRSYHIDERDKYKTAFKKYNMTYAQNYDSIYLFYPIFSPIGHSESGIITFSRLSIDSALRKSLPIDSGFSKFFDLDRCLEISRTPVDNGKELVIINAHLSAYSKEDGVSNTQLEIIKEIMEREVQDGNYVILGGDLNHDLLEKNDNAESERTWTYPYGRKNVAEGCSFAMDSFDEAFVNNLPKTCRDTNIPYDPNESFTVTVDGFVISKNIEVKNYEVMSTGFKYSDHEPVIMSFVLK